MTTQPGATQPSPVEDAAPEKGAEPVVHTEGLTKTYTAGTAEPVTAVDRLDLSVARGEIFGLLGPNGAGKTTTVGMLTTRVVPSAGRAMVSGVDVVADPPRAKQFIGVVHQVNTLDRSLTAWANLYFHGRYHGMGNRAARAAADDLIDRFRLGHRARAEIRALSGGMARRLMIARAILHGPSVLFLDEPTAGLDPQSRLALWEMLGELHAEGQTILLTTHYMEEADRFCDRVAIMDQGRILALDTPAGLKSALTESTGTTLRVRAWLAQLRTRARTVGAGLAADGGALDRPGLEQGLRDVVETAHRLGLRLDEIQREPTLEAVFFQLTGRDLRE